jgi:hypothetical protein
LVNTLPPLRRGGAERPNRPPIRPKRNAPPGAGTRPRPANEEVSFALTALGTGCPISLISDRAEGLDLLNDARDFLFERG